MNYEDTSEFSHVIDIVASLLEGRGNGYISRLLKVSNFKIIEKADNLWFGGGITYTMEATIPIKLYSAYSQEQIQYIEKVISDTINEVTKIDEVSSFVIKITPVVVNAQDEVNKLPKENELRQNIDVVRSIMVSVATGGDRIQNVEERYQKLHTSIKSECSRLGITYNNNYNSLWDWYGKWKADFPSYKERRVFISELFAPTISGIDEVKSKGAEILVQLDDWERIKRTVNKIRIDSNSAQNEEDFQAVGLLCRDVIISLAQAVYNPTVHGDRDEEGTLIGSSDAVRMIGNYFFIKLKGKSNKELRDYAKATNAIANQLTHKRTATRTDMLLTMSSTIALINFIGILEDKI